MNINEFIEAMKNIAKEHPTTTICKQDVDNWGNGYSVPIKKEDLIIREYAGNVILDLP